MESFLSPLREGLGRYLRPDQLDCLARATVGIAGAGGLGSNIAMMLARSGVGHLVIADFDRVEKSNLNRQHYWPKQLDALKVEALAENLRELDPAIKLRIFPDCLDENNLDDVLATAPLWAEALDMAQAKALFVEKALLAGHRVVAASGICGIGGKALQTRSMGRLLLVGDFETGAECAPPMAPRVTQAAAIMADVILGWLLEEDKI